jgi:hypothetical protein
MRFSRVHLPTFGCGLLLGLALCWLWPASSVAEITSSPTNLAKRTAVVATSSTHRQEETSLKHLFQETQTDKGIPHRLFFCLIYNSLHNFVLLFKILSQLRQNVSRVSSDARSACFGDWSAVWQLSAGVGEVFQRSCVHCRHRVWTEKRRSKRNDKRKS